MQIKKRLWINAVVTVVVAFGVTFILILALYRLNRANELALVINEMSNNSLERVLYRSDYLRHNSTRAKEQYFAKCDEIGDLLRSALEYFADSKDRKIIEEMKDCEESSREIFAAIVANREKSRQSGDLALYIEAEKRLITQLNMKMYEMAIQGRTLRDLSFESRESAMRMAGGGVAALLVIIAAAMINAMSLRRAITDRVALLRYGTEVIGGGDLNHRIRIAGNDEFTDLALAFNSMTDKLFHLYRDFEVEIIERKKIEKSLQTLNDLLEKRVEQRTLELQEMQQQYLHAEKLSAIGKLSASIAHEFNNPLQGVMTVLKGLKQTAELGETDKKMLDLAMGESERMKNLIRSLNDFYRPSSGRKVLMSLHQTIDSILMLIRKDASLKNITVTCNFASHLPQILAVPDQIKQVILNLLTNAIDACTSPGGEITISTWQEGERVAMAIRDTGIGIDARNMEDIFRPFFTTKPAIKGTGLGLSISYGIVKRHQGEIKVESQVGGGSTFLVILPVKGTDESLPTATLAQQSGD